jgi:hypothetical protein
MFKRIRKLWKLTKKDDKALDEFMKLSDKEIMALPDEGDGKAVFFDAGYEEEFNELEHKKKFGVKKLFGIE